MLRGALDFWKVLLFQGYSVCQEEVRGIPRISGTIRRAMIGQMRSKSFGWQRLTEIRITYLIFSNETPKNPILFTSYNLLFSLRRLLTLAKKQREDNRWILFSVTMASKIEKTKGASWNLSTFVFQIFSYMRRIITKKWCLLSENFQVTKRNRLASIWPKNLFCPISKLPCTVIFRKKFTRNFELVPFSLWQYVIFLLRSRLKSLNL